MTHQTEIKRLSDGSIDLVHYMSKGRAIRSDDTRRWLTAIWRAFPWFGKTALPDVTFPRRWR